MKIFRFKIKLSDEQLKSINPVFDAAAIGMKNGQPGTVIAQIHQAAPDHAEIELQPDEVYIEGGFIPMKWALQIYGEIENCRNMTRGENA